MKDRDELRFTPVVVVLTCAQAYRNPAFGRQPPTEQRGREMISARTARYRFASLAKRYRAVLAEIISLPLCSVGGWRPKAGFLYACAQVKTTTTGVNLSSSRSFMAVN